MKRQNDTHTHIRTHARTHARTRTHTHIHTHTHTLSFPLLFVVIEEFKYILEMFCKIAEVFGQLHIQLHNVKGLTM